MENITKEVLIQNSPLSVSVKGTEKILFQMKNCVCKIIKEDGEKGTGFFCKIKVNQEGDIIYVLATNNHVLNSEDLKINKSISFIFNNNKIRKILIDENRIIYTNKESDISFIEIKSYDEINNFLEIDDDIIEAEKNIIETKYKKYSVYLLHYPKFDEAEVSYGQILKINEKNIIHLCNSENGSSGAPILSLSSFKVIGIHYGGNKNQYNKGTLIKLPIEYFIKNNYIINNMHKYSKKKISSSNIQNLSQINKDTIEQPPSKISTTRNFYKTNKNEINNEIKSLTPKPKTISKENHLFKKKFLKDTRKDSSSPPSKNSSRNQMKNTDFLLKKNIDNNSFNNENNGKSNNNINNIIIPLLNKPKENNSFLNVIIQSFFHLKEFKKDLLENNEDLYKKSNTIREIYNLLKSYKEEQTKNKDNMNQIVPVLSVNKLRNYLHNIFNCYSPGKTGDPMKALKHIFEKIHTTHKNYRKLDQNNIENCKCPSHQFFFFKLVEVIYCPYCNMKKVKIFNKDCFMFDISIKEIINKLDKKSYNSYKLKLFTKLEEFNEIYNSKNNTIIFKCNCKKKMVASYEKKIKLNGPSSPYLIINIKWEEKCPNISEILTVFGLIPISEKIEKLFTGLKTKLNDIYYIKSIILYGIDNYICVIYNNVQEKWAVIGDKTIKLIKNYYDLIVFLLREHLRPVGLIYSKNSDDKINEYEIISNSLNSDDYLKLQQFCEVENIKI